MSIVLLFQHHTVVIDHAVRGDHSAAAVDQQQSSFGAVQAFQLLHPGTTAVQSHKMAASYGLQIGKVGDDRCLLAAVRQVDEVLDVSYYSRIRT